MKGFRKVIAGFIQIVIGCWIGWGLCGLAFLFPVDGVTRITFFSKSKLDKAEEKG